MHSAPQSLILLAKNRRPDLTAQITAGEEPRVEYLELSRLLGAEVVDFDSVASSSVRLVRMAARIGSRWGLACVGFLRRAEFDHLYATGEDVGIPLAMLLRAARCHGKLTIVIHNAETPKRLALLRALGHRAYRWCICLGSAQERVLIEAARLPAAKVKRLHNWIDHRFYRPSGRRGDYVLSVGMESRDYPTLQAAATGLPWPFRVVASGWSPGSGYAPAAGISAERNISLDRGLTAIQLRDLYDGCRFVVVPLRRTTYAAGVTSILEAMAMGKAVIVSASPGILDYVKDGLSGRLVPVGDAPALRQAIIDLWEHPELTDAMGTHNRGWIEGAINTDCYVQQVAALLGASGVDTSIIDPRTEVPHRAPA